MTTDAPIAVLAHLNALAGGLFLLTSFALVSQRQVFDCLRFFVAQAMLLALSALILAVQYRVWDLLVVAVIDVVVKAVLIPMVFRRFLHDEVQTRREISQVMTVPAAQLVALGLTIAGYLFAQPLVSAGGPDAGRVNLPIGLASLLVGGLAAAARREAVPLFLGLLTMENAALLAGVGIAPRMPLVAEVFIAFDVLIMVFVVNVLTRTVHSHIGTTEVGTLVSLTEEPPK